MIAFCLIKTLINCVLTLLTIAIIASILALIILRWEALLTVCVLAILTYCCYQVYQAEYRRQGYETRNFVDKLIIKVLGLVGIKYE